MVLEIGIEIVRALIIIGVGVLGGAMAFGVLRLIGRI